MLIGDLYVPHQRPSESGSWLVCRLTHTHSHTHTHRPTPDVFFFFVPFGHNKLGRCYWGPGLHTPGRRSRHLLWSSATSEDLNVQREVGVVLSRFVCMYKNRLVAVKRVICWKCVWIKPATNAISSVHQQEGPLLGPGSARGFFLLKVFTTCVTGLPRSFMFLVGVPLLWVPCGRGCCWNARAVDYFFILFCHCSESFSFLLCAWELLTMSVGHLETHSSIFFLSSKAFISSHQTLAFRNLTSLLSSPSARISISVLVLLFIIWIAADLSARSCVSSLTPAQPSLLRFVAPSSVLVCKRFLCTAKQRPELDTWKRVKLTVSCATGQQFNHNPASGVLHLAVAAFCVGCDSFYWQLLVSAGSGNCLEPVRLSAEGFRSNMMRWETCRDSPSIYSLPSISSGCK